MTTLSERTETNAHSSYLRDSSTRVLDYRRTDSRIGWGMRVEAQCLKLSKVSKMVTRLREREHSP